MKVRKFIAAVASVAAVGLAAQVHAATVNVGIDPTKMLNGYINVTSLPSDGGGYQFGTSFGTGDLRANVVGNTLVLEACYPPNIQKTDTYWFKPGTSPSGVVGNKTVDANYYAEDDTLAGSTIHFTGSVLSHSLDSGYATTAFIKAFAADYSSSTSITAPLTAGSTFDLTLPTGTGTHVQYGFETIGADVYQTDITSHGNVTLALQGAAAIPEPTTLAAVGGLAGVGFIRRRRA